MIAYLISNKAEFAKLFKQKLAEKGMNISQMCRHLDNTIDIQSLRNYSYGISFPNSKEKLKKICNYLKIEIDSFDLNSIIIRNKKSFGLDKIASLDSGPHQIEILYSKTNDIPDNLGDTAKLDINYLKTTVVTKNIPELYFEKKEFPGYKINKHGMIIGESAAMQNVFSLLYNINSNPDQDSVVLITGETGTGKELIGKAVHYNGKRKDSPFIGINITTVTETLLESELFGHVKGSFTDARYDKKGFFETVEDGTLFIDEIGSLHPSVQVKLLRVLQEKYFYRVGDTTPRQFNGRIVVATKEKLEKLVSEKKFRDDLYYRLNVVRMNLPELKNREQDISILFNFFVNQYNKKYSKDYELIPSKKGLDIIYNYQFPGNVRELENLVTKAIFLNPESKTIKIENVIGVNNNYPIEDDRKSKFLEIFLKKTNGITELDRVKMKNILNTYFDVGGNLTKCAKELNITPKQIRYYLENNNISTNELKLNLYNLK